MIIARYRDSSCKSGACNIPWSVIYDNCLHNIRVQQNIYLVFYVIAFYSHNNLAKLLIIQKYFEEKYAYTYIGWRRPNDHI